MSDYYSRCPAVTPPLSLYSPLSWKTVFCFLLSFQPLLPCDLTAYFTEKTGVVRRECLATVPSAPSLAPVQSILNTAARLILIKQIRSITWWKSCMMGSYDFTVCISPSQLLCFNYPSFLAVPWTCQAHAVPWPLCMLYTLFSPQICAWFSPSLHLLAQKSLHGTFPGYPFTVTTLSTQKLPPTSLLYFYSQHLTPK